MKKFIFGLIAISFLVLGIRAWASSVTTTDGKNFIVTNDGGAQAVMNNMQIMAKVQQFNMMMSNDSQRFLSDQESYIIWNGVEGMAINAASSINSTTNSVNAT